MSLYILFGFILLIGMPGIFVRLSKEVFVSEICVLAMGLVWLVANYVKKLVHSLIVMEIFCVFILPLLIIFVGCGNVVVIDYALVVLPILFVSHFIVIALQR